MPARVASRVACVAVLAAAAYQGSHVTVDQLRDAYSDAHNALAGFVDDISVPDHPAGDGLGQRIAAEAKAERKVPYSWGGGGIRGKSRGICCSPGGFDGRDTVGFDCSGLTLYAAYQASGGRITLPRTAAEQVKRGRPVTRANMRPGDLIGFDHGEGVTHIGIYVGGGRMVHAPQTGDVVKVSSLASRENQRWIIRRLK